MLARRDGAGAFDVLELGGKDLRRTQLEERKGVVAKLVRKASWSVAGAASESRDGGGDTWIAASPIYPASSQQPHASAITSSQHAKTVQLHLVNPAIASRRVGAGLTRFDEARQAGPHTHHGTIKTQG